eukprot:TRINITY_DN3171_c0_g1_i2.p1 TRINITY_DN3171_c0_g1~~TRINITY_DN3171_c0_g1_i2.p1  ORF type:complete len:543 (+),score=126.67 TRINITY_DN3171_c0_g1_i2:255-1883(+)
MQKLLKSSLLTFTALTFGDISSLPEKFQAILAQHDPSNFETVFLFNNASICKPNYVKDIIDNVAATILDLNTNLVSTILITSAFVKHYSKLNIRVIDMTTDGTKNPFIDYSVYCAGKAGRETFHATLQKEAAVYAPNLHTISYDPGLVDTDMTAETVATTHYAPTRDMLAHLKSQGFFISADATAARLVNLVASGTYEPGQRYSYQTQKGSLLGFCNPLLDISAPVPLSLLEKYNLKEANAILAEESHLPLYKELIESHPVEYIAGGAGQNSIRAAQWMDGVKGTTRYVGSVGKDSYADELRKQAEKDGVDIHYMVNEVPTGTCAVLVTDKERSLVANLSAANHYKISHIEQNWNLVEEAKVFYITGFFITVSPDTMLAIGKHAAENNKIFMLNLSAPFIIQFFGDKLEEILEYVDVLFGNESEALAFGEKKGWGEDLKTIALKAAEGEKKNKKRERMVVFTHGSKETIVAHQKNILTVDVPLVPAEEIVDLNGAGDCFVGGFLSEYLLGSTTKRCVEAGHYCSSVCIRTSGIKFSGKPSFC